MGFANRSAQELRPRSAAALSIGPMGTSDASEPRWQRCRTIGVVATPPSRRYSARIMTKLHRPVSACILVCFLICSVAWTYDAYAGEDPLMSAQGSETDDDAMPSSGTGELPTLPGGGYCNLGCHLAGHLLGPVPSVLPVILEFCLRPAYRIFCAPSIRFVEPTVPPPISPSQA